MRHSPKTKFSAGERRAVLAVASLIGSLLFAGCFSAAPSRGGKPGQSIPQPPSTTSTEGEQSSRSSRTASSSESSGESEQRRRQSRNQDETQGGGTQSRQSSDGEPTEQGEDAESVEGAERDGDQIRVATAGTSSSTPSTDGTEEQTGLPSAEQPPVGVEEALEAANAAVDAAADAVDNAEKTIDRARDVAAQAESAEASGDGPENFDPWLERSGQAAEANDAATAGGSGEDSDADEAAEGSSGGEENFDPFAVFDESSAAASNNSTSTPSEASLEVADDALTTAQGALNRARRALIAAASAGGGDADAEAVQLAAAQAALEAAAEAVVASAIAVMAASATFEPADAEPATPEEIQQAMEDFAEGLAMVVSVLHKEMENASDTLEATAELLEAAGQLIGMVGNAGMERRPDEQEPMSASERVASLEEQLDESLVVFDDRMQAEGSAVAAGMSDADTEMAGDPSLAGATTDPTMPPGRQGAGTGSSHSAPINRPEGDWAERPQRQRGVTPEQERIDTVDIQRLPAQDDDIVARQLREAALAEPDPELRERLWEEYYAYKESLESGEAESTQ